MEEILRAAGVTDVYICGIATDVCVGEFLEHHQKNPKQSTKKPKKLKYFVEQHIINTKQFSSLKLCLWTTTTLGTTTGKIVDPLCIFKTNGV
jgi:hypothetical protein